MNIPQEVAEGVAMLVRNLCTQENDYKFFTNMQIGDYLYKVSISLQDIDPVKEAKYIHIILRRED